MRPLKKRRLNSRRSRRGVSAVEFAIVAPVFLMFVLGMVEFGRIVMIQHSLTNAARAGSRMAALATTSNETQVKTVVNQRLQRSMADIGSVNVDVSHATLRGLESGTQVNVDVSVNYADIGWLPVRVINPRISARSVQQRE